MTAMLERPAVAAPPIPSARPSTEGQAFPPTRMPAAPASPVGRTITALAADPAARDPLHQLEQRLGRDLLDLAAVTDRELHALTDALLAEKHRRASRWLDLP